MAAGNPDLVERSCHRGKARGADYRIQRVLDAVDLDAVSGEALDRRPRYVDQPYMRQIIRLEIAGIDAEALAAEDVVRTQQDGRDRILHNFADLAAGKVGGGVIGGSFEQKIPVGAEKRQTAACPGLLVLRFAVLQARLQRRLGVEREIETGRTSA